MSKQKTRTLQERIKQLEEQKNKLIAGRKEEIANAVLKAGGMSIDSLLLMGFVAFAVDASNKSSPILAEMLEVSKQVKIPSKRAQ
jgi:hypothetical protein